MEKEKLFSQRCSQQSLTRCQRQIADYIVKNKKRVLGMSARELGRENGVSDATVIRFARELGYEGYGELQVAISQELKASNEKIGRHSLHDRYVMQFQRHNQQEDTLADALQIMQMNLETSIRQNSPEMYDRFAETILGAKKKAVIGFRGGKGPATQFARLLNLITRNTRAIVTEGQDEIASLTDLTEKDVALVLNFPRYFKVDVKTAEVLARNKVPILLVTDSMLSPFAKYTSDILLVETEHFGFFHSMIGVEAVLEYLMMLMCWKEPEVFREHLNQRDRVWEDYLL